MRRLADTLVVARPYDLSDEPFDGFVSRRLQLLARLRQECNVQILLLRPSSDQAVVHPDLHDCVTGELPLPDVLKSRAWRMHEAIRRRRSTPDLFDERVYRAASATTAHIAVTMGPWLHWEYAGVFAALPTAHFFEEELEAMPEIAPQTRQGRLFRRMEYALSRQNRWRPRLVIYISPSEEEHARRRFGAVPTHWYPFQLQPATWPVADEVSNGDGVLVVGQLGQPRNAEGLAEVLALLREDIPIRAVTATEPHPLLKRFVDDGRLEILTEPSSLYDLYRRSRISLVPARRLSGVKTTVLQAWAAGVPVVSFPESIRSIGVHGAGQAAVVEPDAGALTESLARLYDNGEARKRLAVAGRDLLLEHFDPERSTARLLERLGMLSSETGWYRRELPTTAGGCRPA